MTSLIWNRAAVETVIHTETLATDFVNLKNKATGARRYGYKNTITKYELDGEATFQVELQTTLDGARYQSSKRSEFPSEHDARLGLTKTVGNALKRYAKLAADPASGVARQPK